MNFMKCHFYLFEIISIISFIWIISSIFFYCFIYRFYINLKLDNIEVVKLNFNYTINETKYSDVTIYADKSSNQSGYIIFNNDKLINKSIDEKIDEINRRGLDTCFIFEKPESLEIAKDYLFFRINAYSADDWNSLIFLLLIMFLIFMKINITKSNFHNLRNSKHLQENFLFKYIIFNFNIIIILPVTLIKFYDMRFEFCFGFLDNYINSFFYDRKFLFPFQKNQPNFITSENDIDTRYNLFLTHHKRIKKLSNNYYETQF